MATLSLDMIKQLTEVLINNKLDRLEFNGLVLVKSKYEAPKTEAKPSTNPTSNDNLEELLFYSTNTPNMKFSDLEKMTVTPLPHKAKVKSNA